MCMSALCTHMPCVCLVAAKARRSSGIGVMDSGKLLCGHWKLNLGSLEEQPLNS